MAPRIFLRHVSCWLEHLHFSWYFCRLLVGSRSAVVCSQSVSETCYRGCLFLSRMQPNAHGGSHCAVAPGDKGTPSLSFVYYRSSDLSSTALWWRPEGHCKCSLPFFISMKNPVKFVQQLWLSATVHIVMGMWCLSSQEGKVAKMVPRVHALIIKCQIVHTTLKLL